MAAPSERETDALLVHDRFVRALARSLVADAAATDDGTEVTLAPGEYRVAVASRGGSGRRRRSP